MPQVEELAVRHRLAARQATAFTPRIAENAKAVWVSGVMRGRISKRAEG